MRKLLLLIALLLATPAFADDISNGSWSPTDASNNASPPNGWPAGMFPNQVEPTARSNMGGVKRWFERGNPVKTTTGSTGTYVYTPTNATYPTAYAQGDTYCAKANMASTGTDTLNVNALGAKKIYIFTAGAATRIQADELASGQQFCVSYDSALDSAAGGWQIISLSSRVHTLVQSVFRSTTTLQDYTSSTPTVYDNLTNSFTPRSATSTIKLSGIVTIAYLATDVATGAALAVPVCGIYRSSTRLFYHSVFMGNVGGGTVKGLQGSAVIPIYFEEISPGTSAVTYSIKCFDNNSSGGTMNMTADFGTFFVQEWN